MEETLIAGRFAPRDLLGQGACGTVLEAMDLRLRRLVALKLIRRDGIDAARIAAEARAAARLTHPNIVAIHDAGDGPDFAWIAMDLVIGEPLSAVFARDGRLPEADAGRIALQLLDALGHAHGRGVVHRDVKPANILLALDGGEGIGELRLGDFGLAQLGGDDPEEAGGLQGTPAWMAPEQVRGEPLDHRADLWAAGVVLYEALTGRRPFQGRTTALLNAVLEAEPPPPSRIAPGLDPGWDPILARALAKSPEARFADAAAMAAAIRPLLEARAAQSLGPLSRFGLLRGWLSPAA
ncbi:serine/threonine protein kinase [Roseococcus sp. SYP-B2431]|uniref:serine/threonine-protein kinase n=1 Tax=Roseococcus sp. SYP-B2431 TaxID=2496640 RepID=UPI00103DF26F|nr:serine/threonine-protein kinase [Roseococcus sp. SYP-B2431]TCH96681.1 serine/threonine protein kinase [Roseococcus sp. SYP-B2431]